MGLFNKAEVCKLVGSQTTFSFNQLGGKNGGSSIRIYHHDGLAVFKNADGSYSNRIKKKLHNI